MSIKDWPATERPRERLLRLGAKHLSDAELLGILIGQGVRHYTAVDIARMALKNADGLVNLLSASPPHFMQHLGFGPAAYCQIQAALELGNRFFAIPLQQRNLLQTPEQTKRFLQSQLQHQSREVFVCLLLDTKCRLIHYQELFQGTVNRTQVHPREVVKLALQYNACGLIVAHNHPSGDPHPSEQDIALTQQLKAALALVEVVLWDHLIIAANGCLALSEYGLI